MGKSKRGRRPTPRVVNIERFRKLVDKTTREKIAEEIGCDASTVTKHYNGNQGIDIEFLQKYARFFGVSSDYLLDLSSVPHNDEDLYWEGFRDGIYHTADCVDHELRRMKEERLNNGK